MACLAAWQWWAGGWRQDCQSPSALGKPCLSCPHRPGWGWWQAGGWIRHPAEHGQAAGRVYQRTVDAEIERAVAREVLLLAVAHHEVAITLDGHVGELAGGLQRALRLNGVDATDQHTQTHLLGVDAAATTLWAACAADRLGEAVLEGDPRLLEAGPVDGGDV